MIPFVRLIVALVLGSVSLVAFFLVVSALFPGRVVRTRASAESMAGRSLLIGVVNLVFFAAVGLAAFALNGRVGGGVLVIPGLAVWALLASGVSFGLAGLVSLVGERLAPNQSAIGRTVCGTLALAWAAATPVVGWFLLLPYLCSLGLGAFVVSFFLASQAEPASASLAATQPPRA